MTWKKLKQNNVSITKTAPYNLKSFKFKVGFNILPAKLATLDCSFKSQILACESAVPVPKINPSGWNWAVVRPVEAWSMTCRQSGASLGLKFIILKGPKEMDYNDPFSSLTLVRSLPERISENAQCWSVEVESTKSPVG